jgi:hypothetical protein
LRKKIERLDTPWGRAYVLGEGQEVKFLPSVTTVLSLISSSYLTDLEEKIGKEEMKKISDKALLRGTAMHKFLENYIICFQKTNDHEKSLLYTQRKSTDELLHDMEKPSVDLGRSLFYNIYHEGLLKGVNRVLLKESFLYSEEHLFAGTTDFGYADFDKNIVIVDFKSASSPRIEEVIHKYEIQGGAYAIAFEENFKRPVDRIEIWISHPDGVQKVVTRDEVLETRKQEFLGYCKKYHEMWQTDKIAEFYTQKYIASQNN